MKNIVLIILVAFVVWLAATGKLKAWFDLAMKKTGAAATPAP